MEDYHLLDLIGEGSFGKVYKGRRRYCGQTVALKFIPKGNKTKKDLKALRQVRDRARAPPVRAARGAR
jgi:fused-like protein